MEIAPLHFATLVASPFFWIGVMLRVPCWIGLVKLAHCRIVKVQAHVKNWAMSTSTDCGSLIILRENPRIVRAWWWCHGVSSADRLYD